MTNFPNTTLANNLYPLANATASSSPFVDIFLPRDPTANDVNYPTQKKWLNTTDGHYWMLEGFTSSGGVVLADWIKIASTEHVETLTGNTGGAVGPTANNINVVGDGNYIITTGDPATSILTISPGGALTTLYTADTGTATPMAGNLNVFGGTGIDTSASGNTITIEITGGSAVTGNTVDTNTAPGTNPVLPNGSGIITVTGGQVTAGTTTNVIRTDSLAANTYSIQVQRSQAVASTTIGDNGVSHFDSASFTVDANGFVQIIATGPHYYSLTPYIVGSDTHSQYSTIASAVAQAVADGASSSNPKNIYIKPESGGYTENVTLSDGINLIGFGQSTLMIGKLSMTTAGTATVNGMTLKTNSDYAVSVTGSSASLLYIIDCFIDCTNNTGVQYSSSSASSLIEIEDCTWDFGTTGIALFTSSGAGTLFFIDCDGNNTGGTSTASTISAGVLGIRRSAFEHPVTSSGTAQFTAVYLQMYTVPQNTTCLTLGGSGIHNFFQSTFQSGSASAVVINNTSLMSHIGVTSSNTHVLTGSGTLTYAFISFEGSSAGHNVNTETALTTI